MAGSAKFPLLSVYWGCNSGSCAASGSVWSASTSGTVNDLGAIIYANDTFVAVGVANTIFTSSDGSSDWASQTSGSMNTLRDITYGNGRLRSISRRREMLMGSENFNLFCSILNIRLDSIISIWYSKTTSKTEVEYDCALFWLYKALL